MHGINTISVVKLTTMIVKSAILAYKGINQHVKTANKHAYEGSVTLILVIDHHKQTNNSLYDKMVPTGDEKYEVHLGEWVKCVTELVYHMKDEVERLFKRTK
jgi:hypothetical protein